MAHDWNEFDIIINQPTPIGKKSLTEGQVCEPLGVPLYPGDKGDGVLQDAIKAVFDIEKSLIFDEGEIDALVYSQKIGDDWLISKSDEYTSTDTNDITAAADELLGGTNNAGEGENFSHRSFTVAFSKRYEKLTVLKKFFDMSNLDIYLEAVRQLVYGYDVDGNDIVKPSTSRRRRQAIVGETIRTQKTQKTQLKDIKKCLIDEVQVNRILSDRLKDDDIITKKILDQHSHEDQVRGAVEVAKLVGVEPEEGEIKYEITRENMVAQMRQNKTYQFCMLLAGFTGEKMDKYWITPSEVNQGGQKRKHEEINEEQREKIKRKIERIFDICIEWEDKLYTKSGKTIFYKEFQDKIIRVLSLMSKITSSVHIKHIYETIDEYKAAIREFEPLERGENDDDKHREEIREYFSNIKLLAIMEFPDLENREASVNKQKKQQPSRRSSGYGQSPQQAVASDKLNEKTRASTGASSELNSEFHNWYINTSWADGRIHLSPTLYAHIEEAYTVLRMRWKHLKEVDLSHFIESPTVRAYFARLVAFCIRTSDTLSGKRYHLQANYRRINFEKAKLSNIFRHVHFRGRQLVYDRSDDSGRYAPGTKDWSNKEYLDTKAIVDSRELSLDKHGYPQNQAVIATFLAEKAKEAQILNALRN